jgi:antitoxin component of MazEF toxin-antitoxin module
MGELTTLIKAATKQQFSSLRTVVPTSLVKQLNLKPKDQLDWSWEVVGGQMVVVVRKATKK